jgi:hypothetical protein
VCVLSDSPNSAELHSEDFCDIYQGRVNDGKADVSWPFVCEIDLDCKHGWTRYSDGSATEGRDSCYMVSPGTVASWAVAKASCPIGSHLLTITGTSKASNSLLGAVRSTMTNGFNAYYGCSQAASATSRFAGWSWVDGTGDANVNCGSIACNVWNSSQPE